MPEVLELAQLAQDDGVAEVDVGSGGIDAELDSKGLALRQLLLQPAFGERVHGVPGEEAGRFSRVFRHGLNARLPPRRRERRTQLSAASHTHSATRLRARVEALRAFRGPH